MSHHGPTPFDLRKYFQTAHDEGGPESSDRPGPTGKFPRGKLNETDEGEIQVAIAADRAKGVVIVDFGKPTAWIGFTAKQAVELAETINKKAWELRGVDPAVPLSAEPDEGDGAGA